MDRRFPWPMTAAWLAVGVTAHLSISDVLHGHSTLFTATVTVEAWAIWAAVWVALLIPRIITLTLERIGVPVAPVAAIAVVVWGGFDARGVAFLVTSMLALAVLAHPSTIDTYIDGSSYGPERRYGLRTPSLTALVAVPLTWLVAVAILAVPPLVASRSWIVAVVLAVGWGVGVRWAFRSLHLPARRWVVFVPAGMVIADPLLLVDALLLPRRNITTLGPAFAHTDAIDLSRGTLGLALQVDLSEAFEIPLRNPSTGEEDALVADRLAFAVLRPGALLDDAARHRVTVGETQAEAPTCVHHVEESQTAVALPRTRSPR